jgi:hypothetical protein
MPDATTTGPGTSEGPPQRKDATHWNWLLVIPLVAVLYPPLYNRADPVLFGIPFFYWYQLAIIPVSVACTVAVYLRGRRPAASSRSAGRNDDSGTGGPRGREGSR